MTSTVRFAGLLLAALLSGCAGTPYMATSDFSGHAGELKKIGVVTDIRIYTPGGLAADRSAQSMKDFEAVSVQDLTDKGYVVTVLPLDDGLRAVLTQYQAVRQRIERPFDSSGGQIEGLAPIPGAAAAVAQANVDGIVIVCGVDHLMSGMAFGASLAGRVLTQGALAPSTREPIGYADFAILDKTGRITFYDGRSGTQVNLTNADGVGDIASAFAKDMVLARQPAKEK